VKKKVYVCWSANGADEQAAMETLRGLWGAGQVTELRLTFPGSLVVARITTPSPDRVRQAMEATGLPCAFSEREVCGAEFFAGPS
jgi:hypothetical protein